MNFIHCSGLFISENLFPDFFSYEFHPLSLFLSDNFVPRLFSYKFHPLFLFLSDKFVPRFLGLWISFTVQGFSFLKILFPDFSSYEFQSLSLFLSDNFDARFLLWVWMLSTVPFHFWQFWSWTFLVIKIINCPISFQSCRQPMPDMSHNASLR